MPYFDPLARLSVDLPSLSRWPDLLAAVPPDLPAISAYLAEGAHPNEVYAPKALYPLLHICRAHKSSEHLLPLLTLLFEAGANPNQQNEDGFTTLHSLCDGSSAFELGALESLFLHYPGTIDVNLPCQDKHSPLLWANVQYGPACPSQILMNESVMRLLLKQGANINAFDQTGHSVLSLSLSWGYPPAHIDFLIEQGADLHHQHQSRHEALHWAIQMYRNHLTPEHLESIGVLISHGADLLLKDSDGHNMLHLMCQIGPDAEEGLRFLTQAAGTSLKTLLFDRNQDGRTPKELALFLDYPSHAALFEHLEMAIQEREVLDQCIKPLSRVDAKVTPASLGTDQALPRPRTL